MLFLFVYSSMFLFIIHFKLLFFLVQCRRFHTAQVNIFRKKIFLIWKRFAKMLNGTFTFKKLKAIAWRCSVEKVSLEISQNSQENTCARVCFLVKLQAFFIKKKRQCPRCLSVNFANFLRTLFLQNTSCGCFWKNVNM